MVRSVKMLGMSLTVALILLTGVCTVCPAQEEGGEKVMALLEKGIQLYEEGQYAEARSALEEVIALKPGSKVALYVWEKAEIEELLRMVDRKEVAPAVRQVMEVLTRALREKKRSVEGIEKLLADFQSHDMETYARALNRLIGYGPYAVPYLLDFLVLDSEEDMRVVARTQVAITRMHRDVALPLIEALATEDGLLKIRVAGILGQLGDKRAAPALLALARNEQANEALRDTAGQALVDITGLGPEALGSTAAAYESLAQAYLCEDADIVGYLGGDYSEVWRWNADAAELTGKLDYELVPNFLYYLRAGGEVALEGLALEPGNELLQSLLLALVTIEASRCEVLASDEMPSSLGGGQVREETKAEAAGRLEDLLVRWPVLCHLCSPAVVGRALELTLAMGEGAASLRLTKALGSKEGLTVEGGGSSLVAALDSGDKGVRYHAAAELVKHSPEGTFGEPQKVMHVLSAALRQAAAKNALLVFDNLNTRNMLSAILQEQNVASIGCSADAVRINMALNLEPAIDSVFLTGNLTDTSFESLLSGLKADVRTKTVPLFVVVDTEMESADLSRYEGITSALSIDDLRAEKIGPLMEEHVLTQSPTPLTEEKEAIVLKAARALALVDPLMTRYDLSLVESALIDALRGYSEEVQGAALRALARSGSAGVASPASEIVASEASSGELKIVACRAIAAVLRRSGQPAGEDVVNRLLEALVGGDQAVREAAAEALGAAGIAPADALALKARYARPTE